MSLRFIRRSQSCFRLTYVSLEKQENNGALCVVTELLFLGTSSSEAALHLFRFWCMASDPHGPPPPSSLSHATRSNKDTRHVLKTGQSSRALTQKQQNEALKSVHVTKN